MTQAAGSFFKIMQAIEEKEHVAAVFLRGNSNFMIIKAAHDPELPGIWVCHGAHGHTINIQEDAITAVVEHKSLPQ